MRFTNPFGWIGWGIVLILVGVAVSLLWSRSMGQWFISPGTLLVVIGIWDRRVNRT
jgi:hypothetical protein